MARSTSGTRRRVASAGGMAPSCRAQHRDGRRPLPQGHIPGDEPLIRPACTLPAPGYSSTKCPHWPGGRVRAILPRPEFARKAMIHHLSIAARDPKQAAGVLAELMGGTAVPFPPNPGSFFALQLDDHGSGVEVYPAGTVLQPGGEVGGKFTKNDPRGYGSTHFALSVATDPG